MEDLEKKNRNPYRVIDIPNKFRKVLVDNQEGIYTMNIEYKTWYGWITIKILEDSDLDYLNLCADEILEKLNSKI